METTGKAGSFKKAILRFCGFCTSYTRQRMTSSFIKAGKSLALFAPADLALTDCRWRAVFD